MQTMTIPIPSRFRVVFSFVILLTFLACSGGNLFCPMAYSYGGEVSHHSASHEDPAAPHENPAAPHENPEENTMGCPDLALASAASLGDFNPAVIDLKVPSWSSGTSVFLPASLDSPLSSNPPLLFLLLSTLRN